MINKDYSSEGKGNLDVMNCAIKYNQEIFKFLTKNIRKDTLILDFGAGFGEFCNRFHGENITVIEADESMHSALKYKAYQSFEEIQSKFNLIYSSNVLEHIEDDKLIIEQFYKYLNTNGVVRVFLPAKMVLFSKMDEVVGHYRRYEKPALVELFESSGFIVNYCHFFDSLGFFSSFVYNKINRTGIIDKKSIIFYDKFLLPISLFIDKLGFKHIIGKNLMLEAVKK